MATNVHFDCFDVDLATGQFLKRGVRVRLREQSFQVLASLVEHTGQVVTRDDLQRRLWPDDVFVDVENNLNTAIGRLRQALGDSADHPRFIETLPRRGYRFIGTVSDTLPVPRPQGARAMRRWRPAAGLGVPGTAWVLEEKLGEGGFGEVWLGRHRRMKEPRVFKRFELDVLMLHHPASLFSATVRTQFSFTRRLSSSRFLHRPVVEQGCVRGAGLSPRCETRPSRSASRTRTPGGCGAVPSERS